MWWLIWANLPGIIGTQIYDTTVFASVLLGTSMSLFPEEIWMYRIEEIINALITVDEKFLILWETERTRRQGRV